MPLRGKPRPADVSGRERLLIRALWALAAFCCCVVLYYVVFPSRTSFHADCTDTLYWAMASYDAGAIFNRDFYYATLQPFGGNLLMLPFIPIWGFSLTTHIAGMVTMTLLLFAALWFFVSALDIGRKRQLILFSAAVMLLCGSAKLREIYLEHIIYYSLGTLFTLLFLGLLFRMQKALRVPGPAFGRKRKFAVWGASWCLLGFLAGTDGFQVLVFCAVPVAAGLCAERLLDGNRPLKSRQNLLAAGLVAALGICTAAGHAALNLLSAGTREALYAERYMRFSPIETWGDHILSLPGFWASLLGFNADPYEDIATVTGAVELLRLFAAALLFVLPICAALRYKRLKSDQFRILLSVHGVQMAITILSHVAGSTGSVNWRFAPAVFTAILCSVWYLTDMPAGGVLRRVAALLLAALACCCALNAFTMLRQPVKDAHLPQYDLISALRENGLDYGYAGFKDSQVVTVLSANSVKVRNVYFDAAGVTMAYYQSEHGWYEDVPGQERYFVVTTQDEYDKLLDDYTEWRALQKEVTEEIVSGPYLVLVFSENPARM